MKINEKTYYTEYKKLDKNILSDFMKKMHRYINRFTNNGLDWTKFQNNEEHKRIIDKYFELVELYIERQMKPEKSANKGTVQKKITIEEQKPNADNSVDKIALKLALKNHFDLMNKREFLTSELIDHWDFLINFNSKYQSSIPLYLSDINTQKKVDQALVKLRDFAYENNLGSNLKSQKKENEIKKKIQSNSQAKIKPKEAIKVGQKDLLSVEIKMIKRYLNLDGKEKNRNQIRLFISALQKTIREGKITKNSKFANEITTIQKQLIVWHGKYKNDLEELEVSILPATREKLLSIIGMEIEMVSVKFIQSYFNLQGKIIPIKRAHNLHTRITRSFNSGKFNNQDKYWSEIETILETLAVFIRDNKTKGEGILKIEQRALNGLSGIISGSDYPQSLNGLSSKPIPLDIKQLTRDYLTNQNGIGGKEGFFMSSMDIENLEFEHLGLFGRWLNLIGDAAVGARIAVYGEPKIGKSYLMIEFAGDLAKSGKKVLYVTKEEGESATLKKKFIETSAKHPNLDVCDYIPGNLEEYDVVFFDSISKLKLTPENLLAIKWAYPKLVKVEIHQVTKDGKARGFNDFIHDVDSIIHLPERGKAIQEGRYEEHGEINWNVAA